MLAMLRKAQEQTGRVPKALQDRPTLHPHLEDTLAAFWSLCSDRGGDGTGAILFMAISEYARRHRIGDGDPDAFGRFEQLIRAADAVWMKDARKRRDQAARDARNRAKAGGG